MTIQAMKAAPKAAENNASRVNADEFLAQAGAEAKQVKRTPEQMRRDVEEMRDQTVDRTVKYMRDRLFNPGTVLDRDASRAVAKFAADQLDHFAVVHGDTPEEEKNLRRQMKERVGSLILSSPFDPNNVGNRVVVPALLDEMWRRGW